MDDSNTTAENPGVNNGSTTSGVERTTTARQDLLSAGTKIAAQAQQAFGKISQAIDEVSQSQGVKDALTATVQAKEKVGAQLSKVLDQTIEVVREEAAKFSGSQVKSDEPIGAMQISSCSCASKFRNLSDQQLLDAFNTGAKVIDGLNEVVLLARKLDANPSPEYCSRFPEYCNPFADFFSDKKQCKQAQKEEGDRTFKSAVIEPLQEFFRQCGGCIDRNSGTPIPSDSAWVDATLYIPQMACATENWYVSEDLIVCDGERIYLACMQLKIIPGESTKPEWINLAQDGRPLKNILHWMKLRLPSA